MNTAQLKTALQIPLKTAHFTAKYAYFRLLSFFLACGEIRIAAGKEKPFPNTGVCAFRPERRGGPVTVEKYLSVFCIYLLLKCLFCIYFVFNCHFVVILFLKYVLFVWPLSFIGLKGELLCIGAV